MPMLMLHAHAHAACPYSCYMPILMLMDAGTPPVKAWEETVAPMTVLKKGRVSLVVVDAGLLPGKICERG